MENSWWNEVFKYTTFVYIFIETMGENWYRLWQCGHSTAAAGGVCVFFFSCFFLLDLFKYACNNEKEFLSTRKILCRLGAYSYLFLFCLWCRFGAVAFGVGGGQGAGLPPFVCVRTKYVCSHPAKANETSRHFYDVTELFQHTKSCLYGFFFSLSKTKKK